MKSLLLAAAMVVAAGTCASAQSGYWVVGHSAIAMTMNVYGHVNLDTQRSALDHLDEQLTD